MERLFGEKRAIILPILLDIANVVRNASTDRHAASSVQQQPHRINKRKYETIKKRHRRAIERTESAQPEQQQLKQSSSAGENKSRHRKSADYYSHYSSSSSSSSSSKSATAGNSANVDLSPVNETSIEIIEENEATTVADYARELTDDSDMVHVTLPMLANRTMTLDEYEDLALTDLNGTDSLMQKAAQMLNETLPKPAKLLSNRFRIPLRRQPATLAISGVRNCELFGNLCIHVEDYPM